MRAVSARKSLTPLAVLIPIVATPVAAIWALSTDPTTTGAVYAVLVFAVGLAAIRVAGRFTYGGTVSLASALLTWLVGFLALPLWYIVSINTSLCGRSIASGWGWLPPTGGALVFALVGGWGLRTHRGPWAVPLALVLGALVVLGLVLVVPGTRGFCET